MTAPPRPAGRPPKVRNAFRWHLIVDRQVRDRAADRARRKGHGDLTDVLRDLMTAYASGKADGLLTPKDTP